MVNVAMKDCRGGGKEHGMNKVERISKYGRLKPRGTWTSTYDSYAALFAYIILLGSGSSNK